MTSPTTKKGDVLPHSPVGEVGERHVTKLQTFLAKLFSNPSLINLSLGFLRPFIKFLVHLLIGYVWNKKIDI